MRLPRKRRPCDHRGRDERRRCEPRSPGSPQNLEGAGGASPRAFRGSEALPVRPLRTGREYISALGSGPFVDICCNGPRTCGGPCPLWGRVGGLAPWNRPAQGVRPGGVATAAPIRPGLRVAPEGCWCAGISGLLSGGRVCFLGRAKRPTALCQLELGWAGARPVPAAGGWGTAGDGSSPPPSCPRWPLRPQP